jgi:predicted enzyme related to lactoylglutathione lyase
MKAHLVFDTQDPARITDFWCAMLDVEVMMHRDEGRYVILNPTEDGFLMGFQQVPEVKSGKNRLHLDVLVDGMDEGTAKVEALGGRWIESDHTHDLDGFLWRCMADPEGNEFCIYTMPDVLPFDFEQ